MLPALAVLVSLRAGYRGTLTLYLYISLLLDFCSKDVLLLNYSKQLKDQTLKWFVVRLPIVYV